MRTKNLIHPGEILREEFMKPLNISQNALAIAIRVPATRIGEIVNEKRGITADTALRLGAFFNTTSDEVKIIFLVKFSLRYIELIFSKFDKHTNSFTSA